MTTSTSCPIRCLSRVLMGLDFEVLQAAREGEAAHGEGSGAPAQQELAAVQPMGLLVPAVGFRSSGIAIRHDEFACLG